MCYVATSDDEPIVLGNEHNLVYEFEYYNGGGNDYKFVMPETGEYRFTVDLNTMKLRVDQPGTELNAPHSDREIIYYSHSGKLFLKGNAGQRLQVAVYGIDGRKVAAAIFVENAEIALPKGFYIVVPSDGSGKRVAGRKVLVY
jgi:hypothetical protein